MTLAPNQPLAHPERPVVAAEGEHSRAVPPVDARVHAGSTHRFRVAMAGVVVLAAAVQAAVLAVVGSSNLSAWARFDAAQARMLESGAWFTDPTIAPLGSHHLVPTVANSPLTPLVIAGVDVAGMTTSTWHRLVFAGIFVVAVVLIGLAVRDVAGPRPGVLAALLAAVFPPLVVCPATLGADTLVVATVALVLFATTRFWHDPGTPRGALLGFALALAAMARIDLMALVLLIGIPAVLLVRGVVLAGRVRCLGAVLAVFVLCLAPWAARGAALFSAQGALDAPLAPVVAGANCPETYGGPLLGWWSESCVERPGTTLASERAAIAGNRHAGLAYASGHAGSAVVAGAARLGRALDVFRPSQTARLATATGRPLWTGRLGVVATWLAVPLAVVGAIVARRRRILLFPFVALVALSLLASVLGYGDPRAMLPADVGFVALSGVALDAGARQLGRLMAPPAGAHRAGAHAAPGVAGAPDAGDGS